MLKIFNRLNYPKMLTAEKTKKKNKLNLPLNNCNQPQIWKTEDECRKKNKTNEQMHNVIISTLRPIKIVDALKDGFKIEEKSSNRPIKIRFF